VLGDMIIASGFITYLSVFEGSYRQRIWQQKWCRILGSYEISF
jgi:hypothetical protein